MKKHHLLLLLVLLNYALSHASSALAQPFYIKALPAEGVLLDKGWRFQAGDNPKWADPEFDDQRWQAIDPTLDIVEALPQIPKSGIGWFRLHLSFDKAVLEQQLALMIQQSGASEIYLNGRLIYSFGVVNPDSGEVRAYDPRWRPVLFPVTGEAHQVLAVRYALQPAVRYTTMFESSNPALWIRIKNLDTAIVDHEKYYGTVMSFYAFIIGACALLFFLHMAFYVFYPQQKANLSFAMFALLFVAENVLSAWLLVNGQEVSSRYHLYNFGFTLILVADMFLLTAVYQLSNQKRDKAFFALMLLVVVSVFLVIPQYGWGWIVGGAFLEVVIKLNILRIALQSARRGKRGARFIAWGAVSCLLFFVFFLSLGVFSREFLIGLSPFRSLLYITSVLSIPIATSIYLGLDFAFINSALEKKLKEVEDLSQKTILQEKERQELLSSQNERLEKQVEERTTALQASLQELKTTQVQLIQKEKMASLGEITAGIAHEIQNPLNFINNFSELNNELIDEMQESFFTGQVEEARALATGVKENNNKISYHGKRADAIVKDMLEHSRTPKGGKQQTDINALTDEYLHLAYYGFKAKDKEFTCTLDTSYDLNLVKMEVVPQELGRVLLNLFNNAFYAVRQKQLLEFEEYEPKVRVSTGSHNGKIEIRVWDNGTGIPESVKNKIFQPFFTTKPTGQGTGLGLSLSYDIITKRHHGGELTVATGVGEWTEFTITLPYVPVAEKLPAPTTAPPPPEDVFI